MMHAPEGLQSALALGYAHGVQSVLAQPRDGNVAGTHSPSHVFSPAAQSAPPLPPALLLVAPPRPAPLPAVPLELVLAEPAPALDASRASSELQATTSIPSTNGPAESDPRFISPPS